MTLRRTELLSIFAIFAMTRLVLVLIGIVSLTYLPAITGPEYRHLAASPVIDMWYRWDAGFYVAIARYGYGWNVNHQLNADTVFLPLYPLTIRAADNLTGCSTSECAVEAGLLISNMALLLATWLLYSFVTQYADEAQAWSCVWLLMLVPGGVFLSGVYAEPLFFCLTVLCFLWLSQDRFVAAAGIAGLAALTRPVGVALYASLLVYLWQKYQGRVSWRRWLVAHTPLVAFGLYVLLVGANTHDLFGYFTAYHAAWQREVAASPFATFFVYFSGQPVSMWGWRLSWLDLGFAVFYLGLAVLAIRHDLPLGSFALVAILIPIASGNLLGIPRYGMVILPFYLVLAQWARVVWKRMILYSVSSVLMVLFTARFVLWRWLA